MKTPQVPMPKVKDKETPEMPNETQEVPNVENAENKPINFPMNVGDGTEESFEEDFSDVNNDFPMAEEGYHHAKVVDFEKSFSKSGNPQYVWEFRITAGKSKDIKIRHWTSLLPQARWKAAETLDAVGIAAAGSIAKFTKKDIVGKPCIIEVVQETYNDRLNHKIAKVYPPDQDSINYAKSSSDLPF